MKLGTHARLDRRWALFFLSPWLIGFLIFTLGPMAASLFFSFTRFTLPEAPVFVGLENYAKLFAGDPRFLNSLGITLLYAIVTVPVGLTLGFLLAYALNLRMPFARFWRTLYYMPAVVTPVITGTLFTGLFNGRFGLVNYIVERLLGVKGPEWLLDPKYAMYAVMMISLWGVGGGMIIYLSGLQSIPTELGEAADLDGCSKARRLRSITIPLMSPVIFYNLVVGIISTFQLFTQVYVLTKGGPGNSTEVYNIYLYTTAFQYQKMGYASAQAWILLLLILGLTALVFKSSSAWVYYENEVKP
jgi:multiple sugar transport system permease protein